VYNQKIMSLFEKPKNVGIIKCADGVGEAGNIEIGQLVKIYIRIEDEVIKEAKFKAYGGVITIASASVLTSLIKDMSIDALVSGGEEGVTLASVVPMVKAMLFAPAADSEVEDRSLKFSDLLQAENQIATILNTISTLDFNKLSASVTISVGADGKLSGVSVKLDVKVSTYVATEGEEAVVVVDGSIELGIAITYTQPVDVVFAIPEEAKEVA